MGRKKKSDKTIDVKTRGYRRNAGAEPFEGLIRSKEEKRAARAVGKNPFGFLCREMAGEILGEDQQNLYDEIRTRIDDHGLTVDDCAALLALRMQLIKSWVGEGTIDNVRALQELGSINRQMSDVAEAYRQQGRTLPNEVVFRMDWESLAKSGAVPTTAPEITTHPLTGDQLVAN